MAATKKRTYNSASRQLQAGQLKDRVLASAKKLFEHVGFEKVTIEEIAQDAQVSASSIYSLYKSKSGILRVLMDQALAPEQLQELVTKHMTEKLPVKRFEITARIARQLYDAEKAQIGLFQSAAILDPVFKQLEMEKEQRRYQRQKESVELMAKEGMFKKGISVSKARDITWALTGRDLYRMLVIERGWSPDEYEQWLALVLSQTLLK